MKQVIMNYRTGKVELAEVPIPAVKKGGVLIRNLHSAISIGTERLMIKTGKSSLLKKAKDRPDLVKKVIDKLKTEGFFETYRQVMNRLDEPIPLGYSCCGEVVEVASDVTEFKKGDLVACFGSKYASHAEYTWAPKNLAVKVPSGVTSKEASMGGIAAIALHAVRLSKAKLGEVVVLYGMGLLGLIATQILNSMSCKVIGVDINEERLKIGKESGCEYVVKAGDKSRLSEMVKSASNGNGADAVIIFASGGGTEILETSAEIAREKATIVVTGVPDITVPRKDFFEKELELIVSRGAGPGIFDKNFEEKGINYPLGYIRWSERENLSAILELIKAGKININRLITHVFNISEAEEAYSRILEGKEDILGAVFEYQKPKEESIRRIVENIKYGKTKGEKDIVLGVIGAGLFARTTMFPILKKFKNKVRFKWIATSSGFTSYDAGKKVGFENMTTDYKNILEDKEVNAVMILTNHDSHAKFVVEALNAGKHVFVEKPLAITMEQLEMVKEAVERNPDRILLVGFNRRFSPHSSFLRKHFQDLPGPFVVLCRVNAGYVDKTSWVLDPEKGGGRLVGEACHFVDLISYLTGESPVNVKVETIEEKNGYFLGDNAIITLKLSNGSVGAIVYYANGNKKFPREYIEISGNGSIGSILDFKKTLLVTPEKKRKRKTLGVDRGHQQEIKKFFEYVKEGKKDIPFEEILAISRASIKAQRLTLEGRR